jgi:exodeoxyribonuclease-3
MNFKVATWNVNSISVRLPDVLNWLETYEPDILALQETKIEDAKFPSAAFKELGYNVIRHGQKTYNGVATISRKSAVDVQYNIPNFADEQRRLLAATIDNFRVINIYIPNGSALDSDKFIYKTEWLAAASNFIQTQLAQYKKIIILGDFNIAPTDLDVHNPELWRNSVLVSPQERAYFTKWLSFGLIDSLRVINPNTKIYSWWDYRAGAFRRDNGLRIDHILISENLKNHCQDVTIDKFMRASARPSDHAPVMLQLKE